MTSETDPIFDKLARVFAEVYGRPAGPEGLRLFFAPGRVNLIGEHTDYNGGHVLPCALSMGTFVLVSKRGDGRCRIFSANLPEAGVTEFNLADPWDPEDSGWSRYPRAVLSVLSASPRPPKTSLDAVFLGTIPSGAGLS
ncbi:MAG: galactokinase, partial [Deltaproteobacteria bacterium]|nr:galactokinase [Deltaproteobacteria bacterium]